MNNTGYDSKLAEYFINELTYFFCFLYINNNSLKN